jgi:hypothetical protein
VRRLLLPLLLAGGVAVAQEPQAATRAVADGSPLPGETPGVPPPPDQVDPLARDIAGRS